MNAFVQMSWPDYQAYIQQIANKIVEFTATNNIKIDFILPILRGGGIPAISLSHLLKVKRLETLQVFHDYSANRMWTGCNSIGNIEDSHRPYVILLVDDYHATGKSVYRIYDSIKEQLPNSSIIYASIGRDVGYLKDERSFLYSCYGFLGNECGVVSEATLCHNIPAVNTVFPWEILEEEISNVKLIEGE